MGLLDRLLGGNNLRKAEEDLRKQEQYVRDVTVQSRRKQYQQGKIGLDQLNQATRDYTQQSAQALPQLSMMEKRNAALADAAARNRIINPVLGGLAEANVIKRVGDLGQLTAGAARFVGADSAANAIDRRARPMAQWGKVDTQGSFRPTGTLTDTLIRGGTQLASDLPFFLTGTGGAAKAGQAAKFLQASKNVSRVSRAIPIVSTFGSTANNQYQNARQAGVNDRLAFASGVGLGAGSAALERVGLGKIARPTGRLTTNLVTRTVGAGLTEGATEGGQQLLENAVAKKTYDPRRNYMQGVAQAALAGGLLGGAARGSMEVGNLRTPEGRVQARSEFVSPAAVAVKDHPEFKRLDNGVTQSLVYANQPNTPPKLKRSYIDQAREYIRLRNEFVRNYSQVGAVGKNVTEDVNAENAPQVGKTDPVSKFGWKSENTLQGTKLYNRNGKHVATITEKKGRYTASYPDGKRIATDGDANRLAQNVASKNFYATELKPTQATEPIGGTLRPDKAPEPTTFETAARQGQMTPERALETQANVNRTKSALEFDKQPTPNKAFHSTASLEIEGGKLRASSDGAMGDGVYLHTDPNTAKYAGAMQADGNIADQKALDINLKTDNLYKWADQEYPTPDQVALIRKRGYDGIYKKGGEIVVFDPTKVELSTPVAQPPKKPTLQDALEGKTTKPFKASPVAQVGKTEPTFVRDNNGKWKMDNGSKQTEPSSTKPMSSKVERSSNEGKDLAEFLSESHKTLPKDTEVTIKYQPAGTQTVIPVQGKIKSSYGGKISNDVQTMSYGGKSKTYNSYRADGRTLVTDTFGNTHVINNMDIKSVEVAPQVGKTLIPQDSISPASGRVKTDRVEGVFEALPDGTVGQYGFIKKDGKIYPPKDATPEVLKRSFIELNADGSVKESFGYTKMSFLDGVKDTTPVAQVGKTEAPKTTRPMSIEDPEASIERMKDMPLDKADEGTFAMPIKPKIKERGGEKQITVKRQAPTLNDIDQETLRDISGHEAQFKDIFRNTDKVFGEQAPLIREKLLNPLDDAKSKFIDFQEAGAKDLKQNVIDQLGIKKGSRESAIVQMYGEGKMPLQDVISELGADGAKRVQAADTFFRARYNELLDKINESRMVVYNGNRDKLIPKRQDYYRHFQEMQEGVAGLMNIFDNNANISPELAGVSDFTKPRSKWLSLAQRRTGDKTTYDAVGGYINYLQAASYATNIDPQIARIRNFREELVGRMGDNGKINNYLEFLHDYANDLSGKTNSLDRFTQKLTGRKAFRTLDWINKRAKSNAILGNFSSSIAQFFNIPLGISDAGVANSAVGAKDFFKAVTGGSTAANKSTFLKERFAKPFNQFDNKILDKTKNAAAALVSVGDEIGTKWIWHSQHAAAIKKGLTGDKAIRFADDRTRAVVAGRGVGEVPLLQKSKTFQLIAPFQLEVANSWHVMGDWKSQGAGKLTKNLIIYSVAAGLMNKAAEQIRGNDVVFDPLDALADAWRELTKEDDPTTEKDESADKAKRVIGRLAGEVLGNVPGGSYAAQALVPNEFERKAIFGSEDPSRFGTSPMAVTNTFGAAKNIVDKPKDLYGYLKLATGLGTPFAGKQIERTTKAAADVNRGYTTDRDGDPKFVTPTDKLRQTQSLLFGSNSTKQARQYYGNNEKPLTKEQTAEALQGDKQTKIQNVQKVVDTRRSNKLADEEVKKMTTSDVKKLSNGKYAATIDGEVKPFKTKEKADQAIFENDFVNSDAKKAEFGNKVYLKDPNTEKGYRVQSKSDYESDKAMQGVAIALDKTKAANNLGEWNKVADKKYNALVKKLEGLDPEVDFKEIDSVNKQILDLQQEYDKYNSRGYISKGKSGKGGKKSFTLPSGFSLLPTSSVGSVSNLLKNAKVTYKG